VANLILILVILTPTKWQCLRPGEYAESGRSITPTRCEVNAPLMLEAFSERELYASQRAVPSVGTVIKSTTGAIGPIQVVE
jgi:hypothetical protein